MSSNFNIFTDGFKDTPFWHENVEKPILSTLPISHTADICIIGAGFTGLATALHLLRAGKSVVIFDAMKLGHGASGKNGGMIGPSFHPLGLAGLTGKYGQAKAIEILQEGMTTIKYFQDFISRENIDCDLKMTGRFHGVSNQKELSNLQRECEKMQMLDGFNFRLVEKQDVRSEIGSDVYHGGMVYDQDGGINPYKLVVGLAKKVIDLGGEIYEETRVDDVLKRPIGQKIETKIGSLVAGEVVVATNGYSKKFTPKSISCFSKRLIPMTSSIIATEELPQEMMDQFFPKKRMHVGNHRLVQYYRASPDGKRVLYGARGLDYWERSKVNGKSTRKHMCKIFPELENTGIDYSWSGQVAYTFDHAPHLGKQDGYYYSMGYCGSGVTRSIYLAWHLSQHILGIESHTTFDGLTFETKPFYTGTPWFLPAILKWYGFLDYVEGK